jgi:hypothetical protein
VRIAEDDRRSEPDELVGEEHARLEHLLVDQHGTVALGGGHDRDGRQVGRERRPRPVVELRHVTVGVLPDVVGLTPAHEQVLARTLALDAEPTEADERGVEVLDGCALDGQSLPVTAASPMNEPVSMWSAPMRKRVPPSSSHPVDLEHVRARSLIRAHRVQEPAQILDVRLGGGVPDARPALANTAAMMAFSVPVTDGSSRKKSAPVSLFAVDGEAAVELHGRAERLEREKMRVHAAPPDHVAARAG